VTQVDFSGYSSGVFQQLVWRDFSNSNLKSRQKDSACGWTMHV